MIPSVKKSIRRTLRVFLQEFIKTACSLKVHALCLHEGRILIVAPHPDDETFGMGGFIAKQKSIGCEIKVIFLTSGGASHQGCCSLTTDEITHEREALALIALEVLGCDKQAAEFFRLPDGNLLRPYHEGFTNVSCRLYKILEEWKPDHIFCPHPFEGWPDHVASEELTRAALDLLPQKRPRLYYYCVWFWYCMPLHHTWRIDWRQARILDISEQSTLKQKAINMYLKAFAPCGNPWIGILQPEFLRAFNWDKELFFEVDN